MPQFELNDEHAIDLIIFWFTGIDGQISYEEIKEIGHVLEQLSYDPTELHGRTMNHVSSLPSEKIDELIDEAKTYMKHNFSDDRKILFLQLLDHLANADDNVTKEETESLDKLKETLGV